MTIAISGFSSSTKTPGFRFAVVLGGSDAGDGSAPTKVLCFGNMQESTITTTNSALTLAAGTAALTQVVQVQSPDEAAGLFGKGSELHRMCLGVLDCHPNCQLYAIPVAKPSGSPATASAIITPTISTSISASYTITIKINGTSYEVAGSAGGTVVGVGTLIALTINALDNGNLPVYAEYNASTGAVTISARYPGTRGNLIPIEFTIRSGDSFATLNGATTAATIAGLTLTLSGGTVVGNCYRLAGGTGTDSLTNALAAVASQRYGRYVLASVDTTALDAAYAQLNTMAGITYGLRQQLVFGSVDTYGNTVTLATGRNQARMRMIWHYNSPMPPSEMAARFCASALVGDGRGVIGEETDPASNLNGLFIKGIPLQLSVADRPTKTVVESALNNGFIPLVQDGTTNSAVIPASITTRSLDGTTPNYSVWKTKIVTVADFVADNLESDFATQYRGFKLEQDSEDAPKKARVAQPRHVRSRALQLLKGWEEQGIVTNVDANADKVNAIIDPTMNSRVLMDVPFEVIPDFDQAAGNVRPV